MTTEDLNILSVDHSRDITFYEVETTVFALNQGNLRWGEDMFGSQTILGSGLNNSYLTGIRYIISNSDFALHAIRSG